MKTVIYTVEHYSEEAVEVWLAANPSVPEQTTTSTNWMVAESWWADSGFQSDSTLALAVATDDNGNYDLAASKGSERWLATHVLSVCQLNDLITFHHKPRDAAERELYFQGLRDITRETGLVLTDVSPLLSSAEAERFLHSAMASLYPEAHQG
ncbi:hypothetical protein ACWG8W_06225 [Citricoccus zhacaiensis]